jgi:hypothetical protein
MYINSLYTYNALYKQFIIVGMTGFEPATTRPPDVCATGLRYIPFF